MKPMRFTSFAAASAAAALAVSTGLGAPAASAGALGVHTSAHHAAAHHAAAHHAAAYSPRPVPATAAGPVTTSTSGPAPSSGRPREVLPTDNEANSVLWEDYNSCLTAHGFTRTMLTPAHNAAATLACESSKPLPPWQYDRSNPKAPAFVEAVASCLRQKGVQYVGLYYPHGSPVPEVTLGGPQNNQASISLGLQLMSTCELQEAAIGA